MFLRRTVLLGILVAGIYGCSTHSSIVSVIDEAASVMEEQPDSALALLQTVSVKDIKEEGTRAKYCLYLSQALDKNHVFIKSDSIISVAWKYFAHKGSPLEKLLVNNYYARVLVNADSLEAAMPFLLEAEKYALEISDYGQLGLIYHQIGYIYDVHQNYELSEQAYIKSLNAFEEAGKEVQAIQTMHSLARMKSVSDVEQAISIYAKAKERAAGINNTLQLLELSRSLSYLYLTRLNEPGKALEELNGASAYLPDGKYPLAFYPLLGQYYLKTNRLDSARWYANSHLESVKSDASLLAGAYIMLCNIEAAADDYRKAYEYRALHERIRDSLNKIQREEKIYDIEQKYQNTIIKKENESLQKEKRLLNIIAALLIVIVVILIFITEYARRLAIKKKNQEIAEYKEYIEILKEDNNSLQNMKQMLNSQLDARNSQEQSLIQALEKRFSLVANTLDIAAITEGNTDLFYKKMKENITALRNDRSFSEDLQKVVNLKYNGIIQYLKTEYPSLSNEDLDFISFICLNISRTSISSFYGYTNSNSVNTRSTRIRTKLGKLDQSIQIDTFIHDTIRRLSDTSL